MIVEDYDDKKNLKLPFERHLRVLGQVLHLQLPVTLWRVNSDTVSIAVVGSASEKTHAVRSVIGSIYVSLNRRKELWMTNVSPILA